MIVVPEGLNDGSQPRKLSGLDVIQSGPVPEGLTDGSLARSAWNGKEKEPVPEGRCDW